MAGASLVREDELDAVTVGFVLASNKSAGE